LKRKFSFSYFRENFAKKAYERFREFFRFRENFRENENFRETKYREISRKVSEFSLFAKMKKCIFVSTLVRSCAVCHFFGQRLVTKLRPFVSASCILHYLIFSSQNVPLIVAGAMAIYLLKFTQPYNTITSKEPCSNTVMEANHASKKH
jgi:hypothetical protein